MLNFEKPDACALTRSFPADARFGLTGRMRRAAVSLSSNLAGGCSRSSKTGFRRFVEVATGSAFALISQATSARDQNLLPPEPSTRIHQSTWEIVRMPSGLRDALRD